MNRKKVIIGVLMAAIFIMMAFIPVANTTQLNNDKNTQEMHNKVNFIGLKNLLIIRYHRLLNNLALPY